MMPRKCDIDLLVVHLNVYNKQGTGKSIASGSN